MFNTNFLISLIIFSACNIVFMGSILHAVKIYFCKFFRIFITFAKNISVMKRVFKKSNIWIFGCLVAFGLAMINFSCSNTEKRMQIDGLVQGTYYHIIFYATDTTNISRDLKQIFADIDKTLSLWEDSSIVNKVNRNEDVELNKIFTDNFIFSQKFSEITNGAFDITVGDLVRKQGFANKNREPLSEEQIDSLLQYVGYKNVAIKNNKLIKKYPQTQIDFNAIAQGYTSDYIANYFKKRGINSFIVDVGGEVICGEAKPNGKKWTVAIEKPENDNPPLDSMSNTPANDQIKSVKQRQAIDTVYLKNAAIVTSGNYRKFYIENGVKYSHTIDPSTGRPVTHTLLSASVIAPDATAADALATACMVMGLEKTQEFLRTHDEYAAYLIYSDAQGNLKTWQSNNFNKYTQKD